MLCLELSLLIPLFLSEKRGIFPDCNILFKHENNPTVFSSLKGCGDYHLHDVSFLPDPCPLPEKEKRRSLNEKERLVYAPMSGVGGIVYDKV